MGKEEGKTAECLDLMGHKKLFFRNRADVVNIQDNLLERGSPGL